MYPVFYILKIIHISIVVSYRCSCQYLQRLKHKYSSNQQIQIKKLSKHQMQSKSINL